MKEPIVADLAQKRLIVPHLGITFRVLLATAAENSPVGTRPTWKIVFQDTVIGSVRPKTIRRPEWP